MDTAQLSTLPRAARVVASQDSPDPKDPLENLANQESPVPQETPEPQESRRLLPASRPHHHRANHAHRDPLAHLDLQDPRESPERLEPPVVQEPMLLQAHQDPVGHQDPPERQALRDLQESPEFQLNQKPLLRESQERRESQDHKDHLDLPAHQDRTGPLAHLARRDLPAPMEPQEPMETRDPLVHQALLVLRERKESARNTAPSTEEFSSRTERDDKHYKKQDRSCASRTLATPVLLFYGYRFMLAMPNLSLLWALIPILQPTSQISIISTPNSRD